ncbi:DUF5076 domain-containing protein [Dokdonella sp.]|uniref:DUF5076 domain-containing protein n=1 Tax=Dokdonella sp. TaxID=2291710 RepID=UPI002B90EBFF|nr:DUF5076 domain-containing protein [Dokdonella sp.]HPG89066.1 DUF5076 domain-containing protein [Hyphomicrobium sp.]HPN80523.1 DUF5076 domain-containing protein [Dokdonella sp.]
MKTLAALDAPQDVLADPNANEILRAWVANGGLVCNLRPTAWADASAWGIVLADVARHVANAVQGAKGVPAEETIRQIWHLFNTELGFPTDTPHGNFV